jgi:FMN phosphatase YigB (HAD superfamily)
VVRRAPPGCRRRQAVVRVHGRDAGERRPAPLEDTFWADFLPRVGRPREELEPLFLEFYATQVAGLVDGVAGDPAVRDVLRVCRERRLRVALATNSVFPTPAIEPRARRAGVELADFDLVTSFERMHFTKPSAGYFREAAQLLECAPAECLMVGNDVKLDLLEASEAGMRTCLVANSFRVLNDPDFVPDHICRLDEVANLV